MIWGGSYGKFTWQFVDVLYSMPTKPNNNRGYTDDDLNLHDELLPNRIEASHQAFKAIDQQYNFYANKITNIVFVFLSPNQHTRIVSFGIWNQTYFSNDIAVNYYEYKWAIRQGTPLLAASYHNSPAVWAHEIMHSYGFSDSYPDQDFQNDKRWHWWGLMGGKFTGHLINYHKWALGWIQATKLNWQTPTGQTHIYPTFSRNWVDLGSAGSAYYIDLGSNEFAFIEYRIKDYVNLALEGADSPNVREVVVYRIKSNDMALWTTTSNGHNRDFFDFAVSLEM